MYKKEKTQRGITLIALVITIIVMLILVAVTISMAVNGGLFEYAGKAVGDTNTIMQAEKELSNGGVKVGDTFYNNIDEYVDSIKEETVIKHEGIIPEGAVYITGAVLRDNDEPFAENPIVDYSNVVVLRAGDEFPDTPSTGDEYSYR